MKTILLLRNKAMARKLASGEALDLASYWTGVKGPDGVRLYRLPSSLQIEGKNLCDAQHEEWIWSVGRRKAPPHEVFASTDTRFYSNPDWECLWLR